MELEQMRQLVTIEREGTISAAAEALFISQPALSRSIRRLEQELGQELFDRTHNRATLNEAGRLAVEHAHAILREEQFMRDAFDDLSRRQRTLRVGTVAPAPLWRLTTRIVESFPGTILDPETLSEDEVERRLINRQIDLGITLRPMILPTCESVPFMVESLSAFIPRDHPLAAAPHVSFADLDGESFLVDRSAGFWREVVHEAMPRTEFIEQSDRTVFAQLVLSTKLLSFVTDAAQMVEQRGDRVRVPISDASAHATFYLSALRDCPTRVREMIDFFVREEPGADTGLTPTDRAVLGVA